MTVILPPQDESRKPESLTPSEIIQTLCDWGGRLVLAGVDGKGTPIPPDWDVIEKHGMREAEYQARKATRTRWTKTWPGAETAKAHIGKGHYLGLIPWSLRLVVFDVDEGDYPQPLVAALTDAGNPPMVLPSGRPGRFHVYAHCAEAFGQGDWQLGASGGDIRCDRGYVVLWSLAQLDVEWLDNPPKEPLTLAWFDGRLSQGAAAKNGATGAADWSPGNRNNTLNRKIYAAVRNGLPIEPILQQAANAGLSNAEIQTTVRSATDAAERDGIAKGKAQAALMRTANPTGLTPAPLSASCAKWAWKCATTNAQTWWKSKAPAIGAA